VLQPVAVAEGSASLAACPLAQLNLTIRGGTPLLFFFRLLRRPSQAPGRPALRCHVAILLLHGTTTKMADTAKCGSDANSCPEIDLLARRPLPTSHQFECRLQPTVKRASEAREKRVHRESDR
jgi:hypothetical protein